MVEPGRLEGAVGKTRHVAYSPLELKEDAGREPTTADHAAVDLSVWAPPGETREQALAREHIRKLAVALWALCVQQDAEDWLRAHPKHTEEDIEAIHNCLRRVKACSYWEWHRGSRIMWFE